MELIRGLHHLRDRHRGCVLSIGNYDGFHRGHQALVARLKERGRAAGVPAMVQIFEPTPREFFAPEQAPGRVSTFRDKLGQLEAAGVDRVLCVRFDRKFSSIEAGRYVDDVLVGTLGIRAIVVGEDFRFGAGLKGDVALLKQRGAAAGFEVDAMSAVLVDGQRASSTAVREALAAPDLALAQRLLGRPYELCGRVRGGLKLGRKLAMPTANIPLRHRPALKYGIYAVRCRVGAQRWDGVANIGIRPTLSLKAAPRLLEAHLFGDVGSLYGEVLRVEFVKYLRPEATFDSMDALAKQMQDDKAEAMALLTRSDEM